MKLFQKIKNKVRSVAQLVECLPSTQTPGAIPALHRLGAAHLESLTLQVETGGSGV